MRTKNQFLTILTVLLLFFTTGVVKGQNTLIVIDNDFCTSNTATVEITLDNTNTAVAFQIDIPLPAGFAYVSESIALSGRGTANHSISANIIGTNTLRIMSFSDPVSAYTGTSGVIATFQVNVTAPAGGYTLNIENEVLSDASGNGLTVSTVSGTITVTDVPAQPSAISGSNNPCQGTTGLTYNVENVSGVDYTWTVPTDWSITAGQGTNEITVTAGSVAGDITVTPSNTCGDGTAQTLAVTLNTTPAQPGAITGGTEVCLGDPETYSISAVSGATEYVWTLPTEWSGTSTTTTIDVTVGASSGNVSVAASNVCGTSAATTLGVTVNDLPEQPSAISGNNNPCQGTTGLTYSVTNVTGVTYTWAVPTDWSITAGQGSNEITVTVGSVAGNITVTPSNDCGGGDQQTLAATVNTTPAQPGAITGGTEVCLGDPETYSISSVSGATEYIWILPGDWFGTSNTTTIDVIVGASSGNISVAAKNSCGTSAATTLGVTVNDVPAQPSAISGPAAPCQGTVGLIYSVTNVSGVTYTWAVPTDWSITTDDGTNSITVTAGTTGGTISVLPSNACGDGTPQARTVTTSTVPSQPSAITGATNPCQGTPETYSVTNVAGVTYNWEFPTDWVQTGGGTTNSVTVTVGYDAGNIKVTPENGCGFGTAQELAVNVNTKPSQPIEITGSTSPCPEAPDLIYSVEEVLGVTYTWTLPSGWSQTAGGTTHSITVTAGTEGGNILVTPSNGCGSGIAQTLPVSITNIPSQPATITGNTPVCNSSEEVYSISTVSGATSYIWTLPDGWTGSSTTTSITAMVGSNSGNVSVVASNTCGTSAARIKTITVNDKPAQPSTITGSTAPTFGTTQIYSVSNVTGVTYTWVLPGDWTLSSGQGTNSITVVVGIDSGNVQVTSSNSCGGGTPRELGVTPVKGTPTITWPTTTAITYGAQLSTAALSGGSATYLSNTITGTYAYTAPTTVPNAGSYSAQVRFTPDDQTRYNTVDGNVTVTVNKRAITVTADNKTKTYGDDDPPLTYSKTAGDLYGTDELTGTPTRVTGNDVGSYAINKGGVNVTPTSGNYSITWTVGRTLTISKRDVTVTPIAGQSKVYDGKDRISDPIILFEAAGLLSGELPEDAFTGALSRNSGIDVGDYSIRLDGHPTEGTLTATNYNIILVAETFAITQKPLTVTPDAGQAKTYGSVEPVLTFALLYDTEGFEGTLTKQGELSRAAGENVGLYEINQGDLTYGNNYQISFITGVDFEITKKNLTITANDQIKPVGTEFIFDESFDFTVDGMVNNGVDEVTSVTLSSIGAPAGMGVGTYPILISDAVGDGLGSYNITYEQGTLEVSALIELTISGLVAADKVYDGTIFTTISNWGTLVRKDGQPLVEDVDIDFEAIPAPVASFNSKVVGENRTVRVTGIKLTGTDAENYFIGEQTTTASITVKDLTLDNFTASNKVYDGTTTAIGLGFSDNSVDNDDISISYTAEFEDMNVGTGKPVNYAINSISGLDAPNYNLLTNTGIAYADITKAEITVVANGISKVYGESDPQLTYEILGLVSGDSESGNLIREEGETVGSYAILQNDLTAGDNYTINYTGANFTITPKPIQVYAHSQSKLYGESDPEVFSYDVVGL